MVANSARVTLDDVAAAAGVSAAAVSLALRGREGVGLATRQRILDVAAELGYRARPTRESTAAYTVGLLLESRRGELPDPTRGALVGAINDACAKVGADVRLGTLPMDEEDQPAEVARITRDAGINGFLVVGPWLSRSAASLFGDRPVVLIDGDPEDRNTYSSIVGDDAGGAFDATLALVAAGHQRIVFAGSSDDAVTAERHRGYEEAMAASELEPSDLPGSPSRPDELAAAIVAEVRRGARYTGVVAADDTIALAVHSAAARAGIVVPDDVSIVGFDDLEAGRLVRPQLTTVTVSKPAMGRLATTMLLQRIDHPADPPFTILQRARVVERGTVAPPAEARRRSPSARATAGVR